MTRGFRIWPQIWNRITFDPFLTQKLSKIEKVPDIGKIPINISTVFFWPKRVQMFFDLNFCRTDLESSHHLQYFRPSFFIIFKFRFFDSLVLVGGSSRSVWGANWWGPQSNPQIRISPGISATLFWKSGKNKIK